MKKWFLGAILALTISSVPVVALGATAKSCTDCHQVSADHGQVAKLEAAKPFAIGSLLVEEVRADEGPVLGQPPTKEEVQGIMDLISKLPGGSPMLWVVLISQILLFVTKWFAPQIPGKAVFWILSVLTLVVGAVKIKMDGGAWASALLSPVVWAAVQVYLHQAIKQTFEKKAA